MNERRELYRSAGGNWSFMTRRDDDPNDVRPMMSYWPMSLEDMADAGMALLPDELAELRRRDEARERWARSWRGRIMRAWYAIRDWIDRP